MRDHQNSEVNALNEDLVLMCTLSRDNLVVSSRSGIQTREPGIVAVKHRDTFVNNS